MTMDAGALIAVDRNDRRVLVLLARARETGSQVTVPATALAQAVRQKRLKAGTACTNCRRKKLRCTGTPNCVRCVTHKLDCIVDEALFLKTNSNPFGKSSRSNRSQQQRTKNLNNNNSGIKLRRESAPSQESDDRKVGCSPITC